MEESENEFFRNEILRKQSKKLKFLIKFRKIYKDGCAVSFLESNKKYKRMNPDGKYVEGIFEYNIKYSELFNYISYSNFNLEDLKKKLLLVKKFKKEENIVCIFYISNEFEREDGTEYSEYSTIYKEAKLDIQFMVTGKGRLQEEVKEEVGIGKYKIKDEIIFKSKDDTSVAGFVAISEENFREIDEVVYHSGKHNDFIWAIGLVKIDELIEAITSVEFTTTIPHDKKYIGGYPETELYNLYQTNIERRVNNDTESKIEQRELNKRKTEDSDDFQLTKKRRRESPKRKVNKNVLKQNLKKDMNNLTLVQLKELAKKINLIGYSKLCKKELIKFIINSSV